MTYKTTLFLNSGFASDYHLDEFVSVLGVLLEFFIFIVFSVEIPLSRQCGP